MTAAVLTWMITALPYVESFQSCRVVVEEFVDGNWSEIYISHEYKHNDYYKCPVTAGGKYRVHYTLTAFGRTYTGMSDVTNTAASNKSVGVGDKISSIKPDTVGIPDVYEIVRSIPRKIQYDAVDAFDAPNFATISNQSGQFLRMVLDIQLFYVESELSTAVGIINNASSAEILRLSGSSIGN